MRQKVTSSHKGQFVRGGAGGLVFNGSQHAVQAQGAQLIQGVFAQHGDRSFGWGLWVGVSGSSRGRARSRAQ